MMIIYIIMLIWYPKTVITEGFNKIIEYCSEIKKFIIFIINYEYDEETQYALFI